MSRIKQVEPNLWIGPEEMGVTPHFMITDHAIEHYYNGDSIIHDPVQPGDIKFHFDYEDEPDDPDYPGELSAKYLGEIFENFSAGGHADYLDMRVHSVTSRDGWFYMGFVCLFIWWTFDYFVLSSESNEITAQIFQYGGYGISLAISFIGLLRPLAMPVRFHKKNQEVYVWHKKILYRIPWDKCEISICVAKKLEGYRGVADGYQLTLWLNPEHAINKKLTGKKHVALNMMHELGHHFTLYTYWEYVRRYMTGDKPIYIEMNKEPRKHGVNYEYALEHGESKAKAIFMFAISLPKLLLFMPNWFALLTPFKHKWPKEVHEWTGERCDWH